MPKADAVPARRFGLSGAHARAALFIVLTAGQVQAQGADGLRERLERLAAPAVPDPYAEEIAADLARIDREDLFSDGTDIVMFTGPDCAECPDQQTALRSVTERHGLGLTVMDASDPAVAALMARLTLDLLPSYVLDDKLVRGAMPVFALERYLTK